jgi:hypothetical protein
LVLSFPSASRAQADASSRALAVQLFDEAEALLAKGKVGDACPKYAESYRLDPQLGALIYLAECYEKNGQLASAWGSFREADELARKRGDARGEQARKRAEALEPRLSYLVIQVSDDAKVPGLEVLRDGAPVASVLWGQPAAIDAGAHSIQVRAPGYKAWQTDATIGAGAKSTTIAVPKLQRDATAAAGAVAGSDAAQPGSSRRIAAIAVGGLGIVGIGVGGFFGLSAQASLSDSKQECSDHNFCTPRGDELAKSARSKAVVATITTSAGVAALATAAILWFTAPKSEALTAAKRPAQRAWAIQPTPRAWGLEVTHAF